MTDAFIYDHVRTPRGRGKAGRRAAHRYDPASRETALQAIKERNHLNPDEVDDVVMGCVDPVGEAGGDIARMGALAAGLGQGVPGRADQPLLRLGPRLRQFRRRASDVRPARSHHRRRRRIDEPRRHRRRGRRLAGRSLHRHSSLFHASGRFRRSDRDQIRISRAMMSTPMPCNRRSARARLGRRRFKQSIAPVRDINGLRCSTATSICVRRPTCNRWGA